MYNWGYNLLMIHQETKDGLRKTEVAEGHGTLGNIPCLDWKWNFHGNRNGYYGLFRILMRTEMDKT